MHWWWASKRARVHACMNGISFHPSYNTVEEWEISYYEWIKKNAHTHTNAREAGHNSKRARVSEWVSKRGRVCKIWWHIICKANIFENLYANTHNGGRCVNVKMKKKLGRFSKPNERRWRKKMENERKKSKKESLAKMALSNQKDLPHCAAPGNILCASQPFRFHSPYLSFSLFSPNIQSLLKLDGGLSSI